MKFGICNEMFVNRPVREVIEYVATLGFDGVELAPFTLSDDLESYPVSEQKAVARCAADNGIEILGLHWLLASPKGLHMTTPDAAVRGRTQDFFRKLIEIGVNTGGKILTLGSPYQRNYAEGESRDSAAERTVEFFKGLTGDLEASGVKLGLEPLEPEFTNFMTRTAETCGIAYAVGSENVGVTLDTHFLRWETKTYGGTFAGMLELAGSRLVHLHIQDDNYLAPGTGAADFSDYVAAVKSFGWEGYISFETLNVTEEGKGEQLAEDCIAFMKAQFS